MNILQNNPSICRNTATSPSILIWQSRKTSNWMLSYLQFRPSTAFCCLLRKEETISGRKCLKHLCLSGCLLSEAFKTPLNLLSCFWTRPHGAQSRSLWVEQQHTERYVCTWFIRTGPINNKTWKLQMTPPSHLIFLALPCSPARKSRSKWQIAWCKMGLHNHCHLAVLYFGSRKRRSPGCHRYSEQCGPAERAGWCRESISVWFPSLPPVYMHITIKPLLSSK